MSDWDSVTVIRKRPETGKNLKTEEALRNAQRTGGSIVSERKQGLNQNTAVEGSKMAKIDRENEVCQLTKAFELPKVEATVSKAIQQARAALKLTQKDLATKINEKPQIVNEYESGKTVPNQQVLQKLERALNVKLRGKDIGLPLRKPKA